MDRFRWFKHIFYPNKIDFSLSGRIFISNELSLLRGSIFIIYNTLHLSTEEIGCIGETTKYSITQLTPPLLLPGIPLYQDTPRFRRLS